MRVHCKNIYATVYVVWVLVLITPEVACGNLFLKKYEELKLFNLHLAD